MLPNSRLCWMQLLDIGVCSNKMAGWKVFRIAKLVFKIDI